MVNKLRTFCFIGLAALSGVAFAHQRTKLTADVGFVQLSSLPQAIQRINPIRLQAIKETATTLGARGALAWRSLQIDHSLQSEASYLSQVFNFRALLLPHNVLPPVIEEATNSLNLANANAIRLASRIYKILSPARFVTTAPTWRAYLWMNFKKPSMPVHALLPNNQAEAAAWNRYFKAGWREGLAQANEIFAVNLARLKRDYQGMILYRQLIAEHMVSAPFVAEAHLGVTGNSHEMRVNDRVVRITAHSQLQLNSNKWRPVFTQ